jgi:hypothetical protein
VGEIEKEEKSSRGEDESSTAALVNEQRMEGTAMSKKTIRSPTVAEMRNESRWRQTVQGAIQFLNSQGEWETKFWIRPTSIGVAGAGLGLYAAQEYKAGQSIVVYVGEDMGEVTNPPPIDTLAGQSKHVMPVGGRLIDGLHGLLGHSTSMRHIISQTNRPKMPNSPTREQSSLPKKNRAGDTYGLWGGVMGRKEGAAMDSSAPAGGGGAQ